jgi:RNA polymerase sigma factor (sigma-70 family)
MEHDWPQIVSAHGPAVWRLVRSLTGNEADARDCYQTVFLEALAYSRKHSIGDWERLLVRIARSRALDLLRKRYRVSARVEETADPSDAAGRVPDPAQMAEAAELADRLRAALALLSAEQAEAFVMRFVEQLSYDEIAARTGSNRNAVGALLHRARAQLRGQFGEDDLRAVGKQGKRHEP